MRYALNLSEDNRILSATFEPYTAPGQPLVDELPEGDLNDYLYIKGEFVYDPLPVNEPDRKGEEAEPVMLTKAQYDKLMKLLEEDVK